jgi:hypothetical protein
MSPFINIKVKKPASVLGTLISNFSTKYALSFIFRLKINGRKRRSYTREM